MNQLFKAYYHSPLGILKITANSEVICSVNYIDPSLQHLENLQEQNNHPLILECIEQLIQYFNGGRRNFELPLQQKGTEFQQKVWAALQQIPFGKTISYSKLAVDLGDVKLIRAAASANGKNNIAVIIPCHRVIGTNKNLIGYMGGLWRKKWLLDHECKQIYGIQTLF